MDLEKNRQISIVISGDVTMDCNIAISQEKSGNKQDWNTDTCARISPQRGSVLMLADLMTALKETLDKKGEKIIEKISCPQDVSSKSDEKSDSFYAKWSQFDYQTDKPADGKVWRVADFLGYEKADLEKPKFSSEKDDTDAEIIILDDANLGFRKQENSQFWTTALTQKEKPWVLVKMCSPIAQGNLWEYLHKKHAEKLIAVLTIDDLRLTDVQISRELSWELTAQDLVRELIYNPSANALSGCAFVIVLFGTEGAVLLEKPKSDEEKQGRFVIPQSYLIFDSEFIEGMWRQNHPGGMIGYKTCMTASVALALAQNYGKPDIKQAVKRGLSAMRHLHLEGYGGKNTKFKKTKLEFPSDKIADFLISQSENDTTFADCPIHHPVSDSNEKDKQEFWTILATQQKDLDSLAQRIVKEGAEKVLDNVPLGKFGDLLTVDRREIEGFRSIRTLVGEYAGSGATKPLSIAVFGAPGSGKSFGIEQIAKSLLPGKIEKKTFNLSQFGSTEELWGALHQVSDIGLKGKIPLVFWDEFDTKFEGNQLGWLRYFLAPMQDGEFQDGQITHPIGRAIFVFAGGTAETMKEFEESLIDTTTSDYEKILKNLDDKTAQKEAKLPDFMSRLKGFVNILGPNSTKKNISFGDRKDNFYLIRRAILLRSILKRDTPQFFDKNTEKLNIDDGVLRALLETAKYKHGVRSIESVIAMCLTKDKKKFERSSLPSEAQLDLHVEANDFMSKVNQIDFSAESVEKLAKYLHEEVYGNIIYPPKPGERTSLYEDLDDHKKELNRKFIKDILNKLDKCNSLVVAGRGFHETFKFTEDEVEQLAKTEHEGWLNEKVENNFRYNPKPKEAEKRHPNVKFNASMLFWDELNAADFEKLPENLKKAVGREELPKDIKEDNRKLIRSIPDILASVGYTIVRK